MDRTHQDGSLLAIALFAAIIGLSSAINVQTNSHSFSLALAMYLRYPRSACLIDEFQIDFTGKNISACIADEEADFEDFETGPSCQMLACAHLSRFHRP